MVKALREQDAINSEPVAAAFAAVWAAPETLEAISCRHD
jgi:hypothetical protein